MAKIRIPTPLRPYTANQSEVVLAGSTVGDVLDTLTSQYPALRQHLYGGDGELRSFVNVYVNREDVRALQGAGTPVGTDDTVMIIPSIAGGCP